MKISKSRRAELTVALESVLLRHPGMTARQLAHFLQDQFPSLDKSLVNSALYADGARFFSDQSTPPRWSTTPWAPDDQMSDAEEEERSSALVLDAVAATNWKAFPELRLPLTSLNLIFGPNSSGKTSILQVPLVLAQSRLSATLEFWSLPTLEK